MSDHTCCYCVGITQHACGIATVFLEHVHIQERAKLARLKKNRAHAKPLPEEPPAKEG